MGHVLEANESFITEIGGQKYVVNRGMTRVDSEHPLAKQYPQHFGPVEDDLTYRTEDASADPGRMRDRPAPRRAPARQKAQAPAEGDGATASGLTTADLRGGK